MEGDRAAGASGVCFSVAGCHFQAVSEPSSTPFLSKAESELRVSCWCMAPGPNRIGESSHWHGLGLDTRPECTGPQKTWVPALALPLTLRVSEAPGPASLCPLVGNVAVSSEACSLAQSPLPSPPLPVARWHHVSSQFLGRRAALQVIRADDVGGSA